jgi:hypothetical protein
VGTTQRHTLDLWLIRDSICRPRCAPKTLIALDTPCTNLHLFFESRHVQASHASHICNHTYYSSSCLIFLNGPSIRRTSFFVLIAAISNNMQLKALLVSFPASKPLDCVVLFSLNGELTGDAILREALPLRRLPGCMLCTYRGFQPYLSCTKRADTVAGAVASSLLPSVWPGALSGSRKRWRTTGTKSRLNTAKHR